MHFFSCVLCPVNVKCQIFCFNLKYLSYSYSEVFVVLECCWGAKELKVHYTVLVVVKGLKVKIFLVGDQHQKQKF